MANKVYKAILDDKIAKFKFSFEQSAKNIFWDENLKKLIHPGEFGSYREIACREFLKCILPNQFEIGSGFIMNSFGDTSNQCDLVIYDRDRTPFIESDNSQRFYPIETVIGIGEIKSDLTMQGLKGALDKLAKTKQIGAGLRPDSTIIRRSSTIISQPIDPVLHPQDGVFTFIICSRFKFGIEALTRERQLYNPNCKLSNRANLVLSLEDGILLHKLNERPFPYPVAGNSALDSVFSDKRVSEMEHFYLFSHYLTVLESSATMFYPEMKYYLS